MQRAFLLAVIVAGLLAYPIFNGFPESQSDDSSYLAGDVSTNNSQWDSADLETSDTQLQGLHAQAFTLTELVIAICGFFFRRISCGHSVADFAPTPAARLFF